MRKVSLIMAIVMIVSVFAAIGASAHIDGVREQKEWTVPHINANNPVINFDGVVDLEGEWKGAVCVPIDFTYENENIEEITVWPQGVWTGEFNPGSLDELDERWFCTINTYFLWDESGLYIASKCDNLKTVNGLYNAEDYVKYLAGEADSYEGGLGTHFEPMFCAYDGADAYVTTPEHIGHWPNFFMGTVPAGVPCWYDGDVASYSADPNMNAISAAIKHGQQATVTPDANGYYSFSEEIFLPWDYINGFIDGDTGEYSKPGTVGTAGSVFTAGLIYSIRSTDEVETRVKLTNAQGWRNYDFYMLSSDVAEQGTASATTEPETTEPEVTEPETTEPETTEPETTEPEAAPAPSTTPSNPSTADVSVIFYALAALSAVGGVSVFKRK